jgi:hypothetical protein
MIWYGTTELATVLVTGPDGPTTKRQPSPGGLGYQSHEPERCRRVTLQP